MTSNLLAGLGQVDPVYAYVSTMSPDQQQWLYDEMVKRLGATAEGRNLIGIYNRSSMGLSGAGDIAGAIAGIVSTLGVSLIQANTAKQEAKTAADAAYNAQLAQIAAAQAAGQTSAISTMNISKYLLIGGTVLGGLAMVLMFMRKR